MRYWLDIWQSGVEKSVGRISVNNGEFGLWNFSAESMHSCVGGRWDYGEKKYGVQGSVYLDNTRENVYFTLTNFFPWSSMDSYHNVGDKGTGLFKKPPIKVTQDSFTWEIIDKKSAD